MTTSSEQKEMAVKTVTIEMTDETIGMLSDLVTVDDFGSETLEAVVARAVVVGATAFHKGVEGEDFAAAFACLTDPDGYGE